MFDFLDKTGLKTVLEQIKAKFPSSLPANGGNADTVGGKSADDFVEALTDAQTIPTRILIPNDVDVADWLKQNAKIGTVYYRTQYSTGQTNLPPIPDIAWAWFSFDGIRYLCKVMINDYSTRDFLLDNVNFIKGWKEISTTPIKSTGWITTPTNVNGEIYLPEGNSRKYLSFCSQGSFSFIFHTGSTYVVQIRDGNMAIVQSTPITYIAFYID